MCCGKILFDSILYFVMIYHHIALNTILPPLTYSYPTALPLGVRVVVSLRGKSQIGIVWAANVVPDYDSNKILPIIHAFINEPVLPTLWRNLIDFVARYYHYPLGQTVFTALPSAFKENKPLILPQETRFYYLNDIGKVQVAPPQHHSKRYALWQALLSGQHDFITLKKICPKAKEQLADYAKKGWLSWTCAASPVIAPSPYILNTEQTLVAHTIKHALGSYQTFVLHGITGSGKTEVYFDVMAEVLSQGRQVLFLLPEINLTPQLLQRIGQRFAPIPTAVLHSQTSAGQRSQDYLRAMLNQAQLIIGTRLAVFTPMADLGLVIVDEEHDLSFKQDSDLRYHARDLAIWRAHQVNCPIVLGSATPSLETWHKVQTGGYTLLTLSKRAHSQAQLPQIHLIDMRHVRQENGFSPQAIKLLQDNYQKGGLSLVYLNRRGFAPALFCGDCGHTFGCPNCSAKMVLHQRAHQLRCHHCDYRQTIPRACPECGNQDLTALGQGTQRVEDTLQRVLPQANIIRVDRDSTQHKNDWQNLYQAIHEQKIDVLVGTQMLAKGHDFARLNLVLVLNADGALFSNDFRANERLFAQLLQVSGRAGRAEQAGKVYIQTQMPNSPVFKALLEQDYAQFAQVTLKEREAAEFPPFIYQAAIRADAPKLQQAIDFLNVIRDVVAPLLPDNVVQFGALPQQMTRLAKRERAQIFIESPDRNSLHRALFQWQERLNKQRKASIRWHIDVDTQEM